MPIAELNVEHKSRKRGHLPLAQSMNAPFRYAEDNLNRADNVWTG